MKHKPLGHNWLVWTENRSARSCAAKKLPVVQFVIPSAPKCNGVLPRVMRKGWHILLSEGMGSRLPRRGPDRDTVLPRGMRPLRIVVQWQLILSIRQNVKNRSAGNDELIPGRAGDMPKTTAQLLYSFPPSFPSSIGNHQNSFPFWKLLESDFSSLREPRGVVWAQNISTENSIDYNLHMNRLMFTPTGHSRTHTHRQPLARK